MIFYFGAYMMCLKDRWRERERGRERENYCVQYYLLKKIDSTNGKAFSGSMFWLELTIFDPIIFHYGACVMCLRGRSSSLC